MTETIHVRKRAGLRGKAGYSRSHYKLMGAIDPRGTTLCGAPPTGHDYSFGDARDWNGRDDEYAKAEDREMCVACMKEVAKS